MRTSYSAIETYLQCPQRYKFQEIDRIRVPKSKEALFGTLIHNTLKFVFSRNPLFPTLNEVVDYFSQNWPKKDVFAREKEHDPLKREWSGEEEKLYFNEGVRMLKNFYEKNAPWNFTIVDLESRFEVVIEDTTSGKSHILAGVIDRIDKLQDGSYEIIDYKTSRRMPSQSDLNKNLQLSLYSLGLQTRWPHLKTEDIALSLYFLKHGEKLKANVSESTVQKTKDHIFDTIAEIEDRIKLNKEFEPMPGPLCDWCGFRPLCPAWKHLYRKRELEIGSPEIDGIVTEYLEAKKMSRRSELRIKELQQQIKEYMEREGLTRLFNDQGVISKKIIQRYEYDFKKIKSILSSLGRWEEVLKTDDTKLRRILGELPEEVRRDIEAARSIKREYYALGVVFKTRPKL